MATRRLPREERRRQIAEAALTIVAHGSPRALTLMALSEAVGIADASILRHFETKEEIVDAAIERFGELLEEDLERDIEDPIERLGAFFLRRAKKIRERPELMALAHNARLRDASSGQGAKRVDVHIASTGRFIRRCIQEASDEGRVGADVPVQMWVWIVAGLLRGASGQLPPGLARRAKAPTPEETWAHLEQLLTR